MALSWCDLWHRSARWLGLVAWMACAGGATAYAQAPARRLVVLHREASDVDASLRREVDRLLLQAATTEAGFEAAYASPVPSEDVELAAGCELAQPGCLQRIAATLDADWLMVRELVRQVDGSVQLTLLVHDGIASGSTRRASTQLAETPDPPERAVAILFERLYDRPAAAPTRRERDFDPRAPSALIGWSSLTLASGLLIGGAVSSARAREARDAYARTEIVRPEDVDRAKHHEGRADSRARLATGLLIGAGTAAATGVASLLFGYLRARPAESPSLEVALGPAHTGVSLAVQGTWRGGL